MSERGDIRFAALPASDIQLLEGIRQRPVVPAGIHLSDGINRVPSQYVGGDPSPHIFLDVRLVVRRRPRSLRQAIRVCDHIRVIGVEVCGDREDL